MKLRNGSLLGNPALRFAGFIIATIVMFTLACARIAPEKVCPDFVCFWTAATLMSSGQDPYDPTLQAEVQRQFGYDKAKGGLGVYDFMPNYYPPWLGLFCVVFLPLGYPLAKITWLVLNGELLLSAGYLLKDTAGGTSRWVSVLLVAAFGPSLLAMVLGQTSPLILFLIALTWKLLEAEDGRRDFAAGCVLALATTKPQLTGILVLAILLRSAVSRRWGVVRGFAAALAVLGLGCAAIRPDWPLTLARMTRMTPLPYHYFPGSGCSWWIVLKAIGAEDGLLAAAYLGLAAPAVVAVVRVALDRGRGLADLISLSLIAPFFVAPYIRNYDFPILLIPALVLMGTRVRESAGAAILLALLLVPYAQWLFLASRYPRIEEVQREFTYFWVPLMISAAWWCSRPGTRSAEGLTTSRASVSRSHVTHLAE